jgi:hypothetical protein
MKRLMALFLVIGLMVPVLSTEAFCATSKSTATAAAPKKAPRHKRHSRHAKASTGATESGQQAAPRPAAPESAE